MNAPKNPSFSFEFPQLQLALFDLGGVLYHANYFLLYEQAREAFLTLAGTPYSEFARNNQHLAIVESGQKFHHPVRYGDAVLLSLDTAELKGSSVIFNYQIFSFQPDHGNNSKENTLLHSAWTKVVFVSASSAAMKASRIPEKLHSALKTILLDDQ